MKIADVPAKTPPRPIAAIGVIGAGTMGGGIAMNFLNAGIPVTLLEVNQGALDKGLAIEPGKTVKLAPGGYHLMMFDLNSPLKQGDALPVTLQFEKAGKVKVSLDVQGIGAQGPAGGAVDGMEKKMPDGTKM